MKTLGQVTVQLLWSPTGDRLIGEDANVWRTYTGQVEEIAQSWEWMDALASTERELVRQLWCRSIEKKRLFETQYHIFHDEDGYHTFHVKCVPLLNGDQSIKCWAGWLTETEGMAVWSFEQEDWKQHSLYHLIFEQASVGMSCRTLDGRYIEVNEQYCHILRSSRAELLNKHYSLFVYPDARDADAAFVHQILLDTAPVHSAERRGIRKDGTSFWCKLTTLLLKLPSGEPQVFLSLLEDITHEKQAAEEREHSLNRERLLSAEAVKLTHELKAISRSITEYIVFFNLNGDLLHANKSAKEFLKLSAGVTHSLPQLIQNHDVRNICGQPIPLENTPLMRILHGEIIPASQAEDVMICQPAGCKIYLSISGAPVHNQKGDTIGGVSVFRDVTEQREKEDRVLQALNALSTLLEVLVQVPEHISNEMEVDDAILMQMDNMGEYISELIARVLQCQYVSIVSLEAGTEKVQIVGKKYIQPLEEQPHSADSEKLPLSAYMDQKLIDRLYANDIIVCDHVQDQIINFTNCDITHMLLAPMFLGKKLIGIFAIGKTDLANDYSREEIVLVKAVAKLTALVVERVRLLGEWARARASELALEKVNDHFDAFLNIASHELRTPLTTIKGNMQLALRRLETLQQQGVKQTEDLTSALERVQLPLRCAIQRANIQDQLIADLLDASRLQANRLTLTLQYCDLTEMVHNVVADIQFPVCSQQFDLHLLAQGSAFVLADPERMKQVIRNYIINAIKRSPAGEEINIHLDVEETVVRFTIYDKGPEISAKGQEHIWEPFSASTHIDVSHYTANEDLGLSLYFCNKIIEYHHGYVGLDSQPQVDTAFWFDLPLVESCAESPPPDLQASLPSNT